jgi:hypothetical protein
MTNQLLQSDIELARHLLSIGRAEAEIIKALGYRKIDPERAARLIHDLRQGRSVDPDVPEMAGMPRTPREHAPVREHSPARDAGQRSKPEGEKFGTREPKRALPWFMMALLLALAICTGTVIVSNRRAHDRLAAARSVADASQTAGITESENLKALARAAGDVVSVELRADGVHVGSRLLNRTNALAALVRAYGAPSRTNIVEGTLMYAYDQQGLVIHCQKERQNDCLVLYFDALGGENGARQPFSGTLRVGGHKIQGSTDPQTLVSFKDLGLAEPGTNSIMEAHCHGVPVSFAYLETPTRLSLVQIDLK